MPRGHLWVQLCDEGVVVEALADVALHMACAALRYGPQALQQRWGAGRRKARRDHRMHQRGVEAPAPGEALKALGFRELAPGQHWSLHQVNAGAHTGSALQNVAPGASQPWIAPVGC